MPQTTQLRQFLRGCLPPNIDEHLFLMSLPIDHTALLLSIKKRADHHIRLGEISVARLSNTRFTITAIWTLDTNDAKADIAKTWRFDYEEGCYWFNDEDLEKLFFAGMCVEHAINAYELHDDYYVVKKEEMTPAPIEARENATDQGVIPYLPFKALLIK